MRNFNIKSILLGIGIGVVLTSIISLIYTSGGTKMSDKEIIEQAKKLGMVENSELIKSSETTESQMETAIPTSKAQPSAAASTSKQSIKLDNDVPKETQVESDQIIITVNHGEASEAVTEKLLKEGLISDKSAFLKELGDLGLTSEINVGTFKIKKGSSTRDIIKTITGGK